MSADPVDYFDEQQGVYVMGAGVALLFVAFTVMFAQPDGEETWGAVTSILAMVGLAAVLFGSIADIENTPEMLLQVALSLLVGGGFALVALDQGIFPQGMTHLWTEHLTTENLATVMIDMALLTGLTGAMLGIYRWFEEESVGDPEEKVDTDDDWEY